MTAGKTQICFKKKYLNFLYKSQFARADCVVHADGIVHADADAQVGIARADCIVHVQKAHSMSRKPIPFLKPIHGGSMQSMQTSSRHKLHVRCQKWWKSSLKIGITRHKLHVRCQKWWKSSLKTGITRHKLHVRCQKWWKSSLKTGITRHKLHVRCQKWWKSSLKIGI